MFSHIPFKTNNDVHKFKKQRRFRRIGIKLEKFSCGTKNNSFDVNFDQFSLSKFVGCCSFD